MGCAVRHASSLSSWHAASSLRLLVALVVALQVVYAQQQGDVNTLMYNTMVSSDSSIVAGATITVSNVGSIQWDSTKATGFGNRGLSTPMSLDACYHLNTMAELLVALAALQLEQLTDFATTPDLNAQISTKYTPSNLTMTNPKNGFNLTYKQLLQHTSSILDNAAGNTFDSFAVTSGSPSSLAAFVSSFFVTTVSGTPQLKTAIFSTAQPGIAGSFSYARANIALLAFILENVLAESGLGFGSLQAFISATFLEPMGMSSTFFLTSFSFPNITTVPSFSGTFSGISSVASDTNTASYFAGCVVDQMSVTSKLHPAVYPDFNGYTTMADIARFMRTLFFTSTFSTIVGQMKNSIAITTSTIAGHIGQGLSLMYFNGDTMCTAATAYGVVSSCSVSNLSTIVGFVANRDFVENGFFCYDSNTASFGFVCVATALVHSSASTRPSANVMAMATVTWMDLVGNFTVPETPAPSVAPAQTQSEWFGVYCFLGVYLSVMGVYFSSLLIQWMFQPAALAQATDSGGAASFAYGAKVSPPRPSAAQFAGSDE